MVLYGGSVVNSLPASAGDVGSVSGSERFLGEGNDNPLQYSCLGNPMDREAWQATVHGVAKVGHDLAVTTSTFSPSIGHAVIGLEGMTLVF